MKLRSRKKKPYLIEPVDELNGCYSWKEVEVRPSPIGQSGLFAKQDLSVGTMIPIIGQKVIDFYTSEPLTHGWLYGKRGGVNGHPSINPYKGVGSFGLSIAMMVNESIDCVHNCVFDYNCLITALPIKQGSELTVYYGVEYEPLRSTYTLSGNKHLAYDYRELDALRIGQGVAKSNMVINKMWNKKISTL